MVRPGQRLRIPSLGVYPTRPHLLPPEDYQPPIPGTPAKWPVSPTFPQPVYPNPAFPHPYPGPSQPPIPPPNLKPNRYPQRINLLPGQTTAIVNDGVPRGCRNKYLVYVQSGQKLSVTLESPGNQATFSLYGPDGQLLPGTEESRQTVEWTIPNVARSGNYLLKVSSMWGRTYYTLRVTVV